MNKELFANEYILGLKDPNRPFPTGQASDAGGVGLLRWRMQSTDESMVPLTSKSINFIVSGCYFVFMYL
jgi:coatomer subunit delta